MLKLARYSYQITYRFWPAISERLGFTLATTFLMAADGVAIGEHKAQLAQAENLARIKEEVELRVQTAYNKLERTRQMIKVSEELLALRMESRRIFVQQIKEGTALQSQVDLATAHELDAKTLLL